MLKNTFLHVPNIGKGTEEFLWRSDILTWDEFILQHEKIDISQCKKNQIMDYIVKSVTELNKKNHKFFSNVLPSNQHWRAYPDFADNCCFLDIETTGMSKDYDEITIIGLYDGKGCKIFVKGRNIDEFCNEIQKYSMIVTFNGLCFDLPFLKKKFPSIDFHHLHIDLRYSMKDLGFTGGLKRIEKEFNIKRDDCVEGIDGLEAVRLWKKYQRGDKEALNTLIKYNTEDVVNLKTLMDAIFPMLKDKFFFDRI